MCESTYELVVTPASAPHPELRLKRLRNRSGWGRKGRPMRLMPILRKRSQCLLNARITKRLLSAKLCCTRKNITPEISLEVLTLLEVISESCWSRPNPKVPGKLPDKESRIAYQ